jgi:hypothetical protein
MKRTETSATAIKKIDVARSHSIIPLERRSTRCIVPISPCCHIGQNQPFRQLKYVLSCQRCDVLPWLQPNDGIREKKYIKQPFTLHNLLMFPVYPIESQFSARRQATTRRHVKCFPWILVQTPVLLSTFFHFQNIKRAK